MKRIRSLDGIRGISIIMVLLGHIKETVPVLKNSPLFLYLANSDLGVRIFFVISGYLITTLLLKEREKNGRINAKDFYLRRIFRIFPVFYLYITVVLVLKWFFIFSIFTNYSLVVIAGLYLWNYLQLIIVVPHNDRGLDIFGHFWTLAMEEQFYLIWPFMLIKLSKFNLIRIITVLIIIIPLLRVATYFLMPGSRGQIGLMLQTGGDSIFVGCLGALLEQKNEFKAKWIRYLKNRCLMAFIFIFLFVISRYLTLNIKGAYILLFGISLNNFCILMLLFWCIYIPSKISDLLNTKVLIQIGVISYSIYIWQQLFLIGKINAWICQFPQNIVAVFVVGYISYYFIEKPILSLRKKFKPSI